MADEGFAERLEAGVDAEQPPGPLRRLAGQDEFAPLGVFPRPQPRRQPLLEDAQLGRRHLPLSQAEDQLFGAADLAGQQHRPQFGQPQADERLPESVRRLLGRLQRLDLEQLVPGVLGLVEAEVPFAAFGEGLGEGDEQLAAAFVVACGGLTQQTQGFLEASGLQRLLGLPQRQPSEAEHGSFRDS